MELLRRVFTIIYTDEDGDHGIAVEGWIDRLECPGNVLSPHFRIVSEEPPLKMDLEKSQHIMKALSHEYFRQLKN